MVELMHFEWHWSGVVTTSKTATTTNWLLASLKLCVPEDHQYEASHARKFCIQWNKKQTKQKHCSRLLEELEEQKKIAGIGLYELREYTV